MRDDDFLRSLTDRAERAVPPISVHTDQVIPRARRRRRVTRTSQSLAVIAVLGAVGGGVAWAWQDRPAPVAVPSPTTSPSPTPSASPSAAPTTPPTTPPGADPAPTQAAPPQTPAAPQIQVTDELPFWHTVIEDHRGDQPTIVSEAWVAKDVNGAVIVDGHQEDPLGQFPLMLHLHDRLGLDPSLDPDRYPEDETTLRAALTAATVDQDPGSQEGEITVNAWRIIEAGGLLPESLRLAAWNLLLHSDQTRVVPGTDISGRPGQVVHFVSSGDFQVVIDPDRLLVLQIGGNDDQAQLITAHAAVATMPVTAPDPLVTRNYGE